MFLSKHGSKRIKLMSHHQRLNLQIICFLTNKVCMLWLFLQTQPSDTELVTAVSSLESKLFHFVDTFKEEKSLRLCYDTFTPHPWAPSVHWSLSTGILWVGPGSAGWGLAGPIVAFREAQELVPLQVLHCWFREVEKQREGDQHQHLWARKACRMNATPLCSLCVN